MRRLNCLLESIARREAIEQAKQKAIQRIKDDKITVAKLASGSIVIGSIFKSQTGKANESARLLITIAQSEKDVINYDIIKNFLTIYFVEIAIPYFRNNKMKVYLHAMNMFSTEEI